MTRTDGQRPTAEMGNVLSDDKKQQVLALGRLGWPLRRIEAATGVRRETSSGYLRAAGIAVRPPRKWGHAKAAKEAISDSGHDADSNPAKEVIPDLGGPTWRPPGRSPTASACEPYREVIEDGLGRGRNAKAIWQDLVTEHGFAARYASVQRFARKVRGARLPEACAVITTEPGEEAQVDYGDGPMVRDPQTGKYRRMRLFLMTLGYSRKSVRLLTWRSSAKIWSELHEKAFRRLGGAPRTTVLDNLREGVLAPDIYDPRLNPLYRDVLAHYGALALPCRVRHPDRKGKVESGIGHTQKMLRGLRFESAEDAQGHLDHWDERWADTRIHGTTKRQVAAMFAEERPHLAPLPIEPFATTATASAPCTSMATSRSSAPTTRCRRATSVASSSCSTTSAECGCSTPRRTSFCASTCRRRRGGAARARRTSPRGRRRPPCRYSPAHAWPAGTSARSPARSTAAKAKTACAASSAF